MFELQSVRDLNDRIQHMCGMPAGGGSRPDLALNPPNTGWIPPVQQDQQQQMENQIQRLKEQNKMLTQEVRMWLLISSYNNWFRN